MTSMYSIYDAKGNFYMSPFTADNDQVAIRLVMSTLHDGNHPMTQAAEDYTLYKVAEWHDDTGVVEAVSPQALANLASLRAVVYRKREEWSIEDEIGPDEREKLRRIQ